VIKARPEFRPFAETLRDIFDSGMCHQKLL